MKYKKIFSVLTGVVSSAVFSHQAVAAQKPFVMAYYANYSGYFNANYVSNELKTAGHVIPEPSYPIPGIAKGYIKMDNNSPGSEQSTENTDLKNKLNGLSALSYGFLKPGSNGAVEFSDSWADLSNVDLKSGHWFASDSNAMSLKMYDGAMPNNGGATQLNQCWGTVCYGGFDAFISLQNDTKTLKHYVTIGGWTYHSIMDNLVANGNQANFLNSLKVLKLQGVDGIDLDIEFDSPSKDYTQSALLKALSSSLINQIKELGLEVSLTIQANPLMLQGLVNDGSLAKMFSQGLNHLNLMTYDFHGAFDASTTPYTGFNSSLYAAPNVGNVPQNPFKGKDNDFSVNHAIEALKESGIDLSKVTIGLPAYSRATFSDIADNGYGGLFQAYGKNTQILPGDLDATTCTISWKNSGAPFAPNGTECSGTFGYNYLLADMIGNNDFTARDWQYKDENGNTYYIGSTAYRSDRWTPVTSTLDFGGGADALTSLVQNYPTGSNVYFTYLSGKDSYSYGQYAAEQGLGGAIVWTVMSDAPYTDHNNSLIYNFNQGYQNPHQIHPKKTSIEFRNLQHNVITTLSISSTYPQSNTKEVEIYNNGNVATNLDNALQGLSVPLLAQFSNINCPNTALNVGSACDVNITLNPQQNAHQKSSQTLTASTQDGVKAQLLINYEINSQQPDVVFSPNKISLTAIQGDASPAQQVSIVNKGTVPVNLIDIRGISSPISTDFHKNCHDVLAAGASCSFTVTLDTANVVSGNETALESIADNQENATFSVAYSVHKKVSPTNDCSDPTASQYAAWSPNKTYYWGDKVSYHGYVWVAKWYSQDTAPGSARDQGGPWKLIVPQGILFDWSVNSVYQWQDKVAYNGNEYQANEWTLGNEPDQDYGDSGKYHWKLIDDSGDVKSCPSPYVS